MNNLFQYEKELLVSLAQVKQKIEFDGGYKSEYIDVFAFVTEDIEQDFIKQYTGTTFWKRNVDVYIFEVIDSCKNASYYQWNENDEVYNTSELIDILDELNITVMYKHKNNSNDDTWKCFVGSPYGLGDYDQIDFGFRFGKTNICITQPYLIPGCRTEYESMLKSLCKNRNISTKIHSCHSQFRYISVYKVNLQTLSRLQTTENKLIYVMSSARRP